MDPIDEFDIRKCRTSRLWGCDGIFWCHACMSNQVQRMHILSFGHSYLCRHPDRGAFVESAQKGLAAEKSGV